jgi:hypothetical protein
MASTAIRDALEHHVNVAIAFQNCHRAAVFPAGALDTDAYVDFVSAQAQLLNQKPKLVNC